jgi:DNA modification methylase
LEKDSSWLRPALADYIVLFRKPGENAVAVENGDARGEVSRDEWIRLAHPIWYNIRETNTLNAREARSEADEKHVCPLQLETIHNAVILWSNPGETIYSPFAGIGSEGYQAIIDKRNFIGCELKPEYFKVACKNLKQAEAELVDQEMVLFKDTL